MGDPTSPGHVFVLRGDLRHLACDGWMLPSDRTLNVEADWYADIDEVDPACFPRAWTDPEGDHVEPVVGWPEERSRPYLVDIFTREPQIESHLEAVGRFVARAATAQRYLSHRQRRLLAVPVVGTGKGGSWAQAGDVVRRLLHQLWRLAARHKVDLALVCKDADLYAAAQAFRRNPGVEGDIWHGLDAAQLETAQDLADKAAAGRLVLFLGAGVSFSAGLPDWKRLLARLAQTAGLSKEAPELKRLDYLDQAQILDQALLREQGESIGAATTRLFERYPCHALAHGLLAALPVDEVVTTNYDQLFEQASEAAGRPVAVLPYNPSSHHSRWLLKMHGCISRPADIVLTRKDYLRYEERRAALMGIVQALLITKHMLFIGFSLRDDNFHRIADAVRRALNPDPDEAGAGGLFGTCLSLLASPLFESLWPGEMTWCSMDSGEVPEDQRAARGAAAARRMELLLDRVAFHTTGREHLLDDRFNALLLPEERRLKAALLRLGEAARSGAPGPQWSRVLDLLQLYGQGSR